MAQKKNQEQAKLNAAQKQFCRGVANGLTPRLAYIKAFDCKESAASACASRMLKNANVQAEISRLKHRVLEVHAAREEGREERALWTPAERMEKVQGWGELSAAKGDIKTALQCVDMLNKMDGAYERKPESEQQAGLVAVSAEQMREWAEAIAVANRKVVEQAEGKGRLGEV